MRICHRDIRYELDPSTLEIPESSVTGYYRSHAFELKYPRHIPVPQPGLNLNYRGTNYRISATGGELETITALAPMSPMSSASSLSCFMQSTRQSNLAEVHRDNIYRSLQHRLKVARANGNRYLIQQLEQEMHQIV